MTSSRGTGRPARLGALALAFTLALSACGGGDGGKKKADDEPTVKDGETLTPSGTELELGESASLDWDAGKKDGVVEITVTKILQGSAQDERLINIDPPLKDYTLYYVYVTLGNTGKTDLGGASPLNLPLYLQDESDVLKRAADTKRGLEFRPCPKPVLPATWQTGDVAEFCLVYPTSGEIDRLVLQPAEEDEITWPGEVTVPEKKTPKKKGGKATASAPAEG